MSRMRPVNGHRQRAQDPGWDPGQEGAYLERPRVAAARRRARIAKGALAALGAFGFGAWMVLARTTYAGHPKQAVHSLAIPQPLYEVVRRNLLQAGILAPATAPPDATTSTS
jgi:hypothetical protein